ncbi:peptidoglycan DD-metalloendopeptidase family protein [Nocardioides sp.]|uniref:peptidoglycan DD-metalloendopeptidase family protein n=1 Tax=Nocardioides sp. TaxID=35761 RepID=UPI0035676E6B
MRFFPRTARPRLVAALAAAALAIGAAAVPLAHADDLKDKQKQVQGQIESVHDDLDESSARLRKAAGQLEAARAQFASAKADLDVARAKLGAARTLDRQMQAKLEVAEQRLEAARADLRNGRLETEDQRQQVTDTIVTIYEQGDPQLLAFASLLGSRTPADLMRRMEARDALVSRESRVYNDLRAAEVLLEVREDQVKAAKKQVAVQRKQAAAHLVTMKSLHERTQKARAAVRTVVQTRRSARQAAVRAKKADMAALARLKKREEQIRQQILEAARKARGGYRGATGGFLDRPVNGSITSPYGYRVHPIYNYYGLHDGTDFGGGCGAPLKAVASGTVMTRYYSSVWGNRLYLNLGQVNGKNLTVIYNHASSYRFGSGQAVKRGETVGYVGSTGWSTGCHLHFTVLVNGRPVDPANWF